MFKANIPSITMATLPRPPGKKADKIHKELATSIDTVTVFFLPNLSQKMVMVNTAGSEIIFKRKKLKYNEPPISSAANVKP